MSDTILEEPSLAHSVDRDIRVNGDDIENLNDATKNDPANLSREQFTVSSRNNSLNELPENARVFTTPNVREVKLKLFAVFWSLFIAGVNDASTGALIPYIQPAYNAGLLQVAILYLINFIGWMVAAFTNVHAMSYIGQGGLLVVGACLQTLAYALMFWKPPFPLFAATYFISGLGVAYQDAQTQALVANVENAYRWLGILHAVYGLGALVAPLVATTIAGRTPYWNYFYCFLFGVAVMDIGFLTYAFRAQLFKPPSKTAKETAGKEFKKALSSRVVWILSLFFLFYVGAEVTSGGWVVQFLVDVRGGYAGSVGYVATGFWGGLTVGRLVLAEAVNKFGERRSIFALILCALALQILFWLIPSVIADAVVISLLGFCIAPFFPVGLSVMTKLLPKELHVGAVGFTATIGQAGSAAFPFMTGAIASAKGLLVLQPIMVGLLAGMFVLWAMLPMAKKPSV